MQIFDITVPASGSFPINAAGRYIKYLAGNNGGGDTTLTVRPGAKGGSTITLKPGQAYRIGDSAPTPSSWTLANYAGGATILGQVVIGDGRIDDTSIAGTVQVVDGGKARTLNNSAFTGFTSAPGVAGQYPRIQLWNPANSGVRLVVESLTGMSAVSSCAVIVTDSTAALATNVQNGLSKLLGGAVAKGEIHDDSTASAQPGNPSLMVISAAPGLGLQSLKFVEPVVVPPGHGLLMTGNTVNDPFSCSIEWYEEPNV